MSAAGFLIHELFNPRQQALDGALRAIADYRAVLSALSELPEATPATRKWAENLNDRLHEVWGELDACRWSHPPASK